MARDLATRKNWAREDIAAVSAQGRSAQHADIEAIPQVFTEAALPDHGDEIPVGGGNDPDIQRHGARASYPADLALIQHAQHAGLKGKRKIADFIQKDGAAVGAFKVTGMGAVCSGKRAPLVSEQLAVDKLFIDCAAVDLDKGTSGARGKFAYRVGHKFLPCAGFSQDEDGAVRGGGLLDAGKQLVHAAHGPQAFHRASHGRTDVFRRAHITAVHEAVAQFLPQRAGEPEQFAEQFPGEGARDVGTENELKCGLSHRKQRDAKIGGEIFLPQAGLGVLETEGVIDGIGREGIRAHEQIDLLLRKLGGGQCSYPVVRVGKRVGQRCEGGGSVAPESAENPRQGEVLAQHAEQIGQRASDADSVSYTHLTLPTSNEV